LVISDECDASQLGKTHWQVHLNTGSGFAAQGVDWSLPPYPGTYPQPFVESTSNSVYCSGTDYYRPRYRVFDINGDRRPDLVISDECDPSDLGNTHWQVHLNTGGGFATQGVDWLLPPYLGSYPQPFIDSASNSIYCSGTDYYRPRYRIFDIDGDRRPDLVISDECGASELGKTHWLVHRNTGAGFLAVSTCYNLPAYPGSYPQPFVDTFSNLVYCSGTDYYRPRYRVFDINADDKPDVVISDECDATNLGKTHWQVFLQ
ncbi:MAG: hypothetical protein JRH20_12935, partial [Deltaproteobacteria bacterium]|nr:hypothetical protein [Deltaproteobacteria bacterium]